MMDPKLIRKLLGLAETSTDDEVNEKLGSHFAAADEAVKKTVALSQEKDAIVKGLTDAGYKLVDGKVVKLSQEEEKPESPREKELRLQLEESRFLTGKQRVEGATALAQQYTGKGGKIPPAMKGHLEKLFALAGKAETLALSQDGAAVVTTAFDAVAALREVLNAIPGTMTKEELSQLPKSGGKDKEEAKGLREKGKAMSQAVKPKGAPGKK
jgi:hypothetical protein